MACTATGYSGAYDGKSHGISVQATYPASGATVMYGTKAGTYDLSKSPTYSDAGTYTVYYQVTAWNHEPISGSATVEITPKTVKLSWKNTSFTYNGKSHIPTAEASGLISGDKCTVTVSGGQTNAGSYQAKATKLSNSNYQLPSVKTQAFTIAKRVAALKWENTEVTYNGTKQIPTAKVTNLASGDKCTVTVDKAHLNAGKYTVTATKLSNKNYKLPAEKTKSFFIKRAPVTVTWSNTTVTYNGTKQYPTVKIKGLIGNDTCEAIFDRGGKRVGKYTVKIKKFSNFNYKIPKNDTVTFKVKPLTVKLKWSNTSFKYDGKTHKPTATVSNLIAGDECKVTVSGSQKKVGSYTAKATKLSNGNYALPSANTKKFTIVK